MRQFFDRLDVLKSFTREEALFWARVDVRGSDDCSLSRNGKSWRAA